MHAVDSGRNILLGDLKKVNENKSREALPSCYLRGFEQGLRQALLDRHHPKHDK